MKNITVLFILPGLFISLGGTSQTATGGCTSVTVSNIPTYPVVYFASVGYKNCNTTTLENFEGCDEGSAEGGCCRIITFGNPTTPRFWLERQTDLGWETAVGPQYGTTFSDVAKGAYRVKCQVPNIAENACGNDRLGNPTRICLFNMLGQFIGYWGAWDNSPFGSAPPTFSNTVIVGATTASDISFTFIDPTPNDTYETGFDFGEEAKMNTAACKDYDLWWLAIFEDGPTYHRYRSNDWTHGRMTDDEFNLTSFWSNGSPGWQFETFHNYTVQFVTENSRCRNGIEYNPTGNGIWNVLYRTFTICLAGTGCRTGGDGQDVIISPNPASTFIRLQNFEPDLDRDYRMTFCDLTGRVVKSVALAGNEVDISGLPAGMFILNIQREGRQVFTSKFVVNR